jgi:hypothetical protein
MSTITNVNLWEQLNKEIVQHNGEFVSGLFIQEVPETKEVKTICTSTDINDFLKLLDDVYFAYDDEYTIVVKCKSYETGKFFYFYYTPIEDTNFWTYETHLSNFFFDKVIKFL